MNYNSSSTNYNDSYKIYFDPSASYNYYQMTKQEPVVTLYKPSWDHKYKTFCGYQYNDSKYEIVFDDYEIIRNNRLNKIDKKKAELLSWINDKESV